MAQVDLLFAEAADDVDDMPEPELDMVLTTDFSGPQSALCTAQPCVALHMMLFSTARYLLCCGASLCQVLLRDRDMWPGRLVLGPSVPWSLADGGAQTADAAAVAGQVQRWLAAASRRVAGGRRAQDLLAGVPQLVAALMQRLSAAVHGAPLDVEISYEIDDDVRARAGLPGLPVSSGVGSVTTDLCLQAWDGACDQGTIGGHLTGRAAQGAGAPAALPRPYRRAQRRPPT